MNFKEYTAAARETAVYPEQYKCVYPAIGLVDELAEFTEKFEDWFIGKEGGWVSTYTRDDVIAELGDVLWYYAVFCDNNLLDMETFFETYAIEATASDVFITSGKFLGVVKKAMRDSQLPVSYVRVMEYLDILAGNISFWCDELQTTLEEVAAINIAKLKDRQNRGVIKGDGDNR